MLLDEEAGLDPLAPVLVDGVFDLLLHLLELGLGLVDRVLDLVDHALGLIDRVLELVDDVLLDRVGGVLERVLRLRDRVLRVLDRALRLVDDVLRARGDGAEDRLPGRVVRALDGLDHLVQLAAQRLDHRLGHRHGLRGAHLDRALALEDGRLRHRESGLADVERHVGGGDQRLLEALDRAGEIVADGVDRVERRRFHRVERVARVLDGVRRDVGDRSRRLVRLGQGLLRHVGGRGRGLLRRLADFGSRLGRVVLETRDLAFDGFQRALRDVGRARFHLLQRALDVLHHLLRGVDRLRSGLGGLTRGLQRKGSGVLDLVGDLLRLLGRLLQRLGELGEVLDRGRALLDRVPLGAELGRVAGVDEEDVVGGDDVVLPVDPLAGLVHLDHAAGLDGRIAVDPRFGVDELPGALVVFGLGDGLEQVLLSRGDRHHRLDVAEHLLDQLLAGHGPALGAVLVALLGGAGDVLHLGRVPAGGGDLRHLVEGVHLLDEAADVLAPGQLGGRALAQLGLLEEQLLVVDVHAEAGERGPLHEEVVVGEVVLDDVVVDHDAVVGVGGESVALGDLAGEIAVLHVLVGLGDGALVEAVALVDAGHDQPRRAVGGEDDLEVRDLALAHALERADETELDLDGGAGLELVLLGPLAVDVGEMDPEAARLVHVVGDTDADHRALQLRVGSRAVDHELEVGDEVLVVCQAGTPCARPQGQDESRRGTAVVSSKRAVRVKGVPSFARDFARLARFPGGAVFRALHPPRAVSGT